MIYFAEITKRWGEPGNNRSYVENIAAIIEEAQKRVRERVRTALIAVPPYDLACINFVEADRQAGAAR